MEEKRVNRSKYTQFLLNKYEQINNKNQKTKSHLTDSIVSSKIVPWG